MYTEAQKRAIYKYKETHKDEWRSQQRVNTLNYYYRNKETLNEKRRLKRENDKLINNITNEF